MLLHFSPETHKFSRLCTRHLKLLRVKFHTEDPQTLGATAQNSVATATWRPEFVHPAIASSGMRVDSLFQNGNRVRVAVRLIVCGFARFHNAVHSFIFCVSRLLQSVNKVFDLPGCFAALIGV